MAVIIPPTENLHGKLNLCLLAKKLFWNIVSLNCLSVYKKALASALNMIRIFYNYMKMSSPEILLYLESIPSFWNRRSNMKSIEIRTHTKYSLYTSNHDC